MSCELDLEFAPGLEHALAQIARDAICSFCDLGPTPQRPTMLLNAKTNCWICRNCAEWLTEELNDPHSEVYKALRLLSAPTSAAIPEPQAAHPAEVK